MKWIFMLFNQVIYLGVGMILILALVLAGIYLLYRKQIELLQLEKKRHQQLNNITHQVECLPHIAKQFTTPQYLAQFTITLSNKKSDVLQLNEIIFITVDQKVLEFTTLNKVYRMDGKLSTLAEGNSPLLPFPLFVRVQKSYIINVLHVKQSKANTVVMSDQNATDITISPHYKEQVLKAFRLREAEASNI